MRHAAIAISPAIAPGSIFALDPLPLRQGHVITFLGVARAAADVTVTAANDNVIHFRDHRQAFVARPWFGDSETTGRWWQVCEAASRLH